MAVADVVRLKARDGTGALYTGLCLGLTGLGLGLSSVPGPLGWLCWGVGQIIWAVALLQWFVLLHECGHGVLFRRRALNRMVGHVAGFFCTIPYASWAPIHGQHHKWTGWQDLDPTTASLVPRPLGRAERALMNVCWRYWIPAFSVLYRLGNFWNLPRLGKLFPGQLSRIGLNALLLLGLYATVIGMVGPLTLLGMVGPGLVLSLMMLDPLMISQHSHIPMQHSGGEPVRAFPAPEQAVFTRSLRFPAWFSRWILLHFDAHELHHKHPFVPGYRLNEIAYEAPNEAHWFGWILAARRLPAEVLLFQNRHDSGSEV